MAPLRKAAAAAAPLKKNRVVPAADADSAESSAPAALKSNGSSSLPPPPTTLPKAARVDDMAMDLDDEEEPTFVGKGKGKAAVEQGEMRGMQNVAELSSRFGKDIGALAAQEYKGKGMTDSIKAVQVGRFLSLFAPEYCH